MAFSKYRGWKVRGFWSDDQNKLVLVKGRKTRTIKVMSANSTSGKWTFTTTDGIKYTLPQAKSSVRNLKGAKIITDFVVVYGEPFYDEVYEDYISLNMKTTEYRIAYLRRCFLKKRLFISAPVKKIWKEKGKYHALTMSGSHYAFSR